MPRGMRRSKEEIEEILERLEASGQSVREFATRNGLAVSTVDLWRRKARGAVKASKSELRRVSILGSSNASSEPFEVCFPNGPTLRVPVRASREAAESMLRAFLSACSH